jgi:hypothetical protein
MSTLDDVTGSESEVPTTSPPWRPAPGLDLAMRLAGAAFLGAGLILVYCADQIGYFDRLDEVGGAAEFIGGIGGAMGLSIAAGLIALLGGAKPWAYGPVIGAMGFVAIDFSFETRFYANFLSNKAPEGYTTALALSLVAWVLLLVAMTALVVTSLATRTWRRPATAPFVVWMVALAAVGYTQWQYFGLWGQSGFEMHVPTWWWVVAAVGLVATVVLLAVTGAHPVRAVRVMTPALLAGLMLAILAISQVWEYWDQLFRLDHIFGYPTTIVASLVAAVLYAVMRRPDDEARQR